MPFDASPEGRARAALYGRVGALRRASRQDRSKLASSGQEALIARFEAEVDPTWSLPLDERRKRAEVARRAHMASLTARSVLARRARKAPRATN